MAEESPRSFTGCALIAKEVIMPAPPFRHIEELFHQAVALPPAERSALLDASCAGDAALRAAVEDLLRHDRADDPTDQFLASPVADEAERHRLAAQTLPAPGPGGAAAAGPALPHVPGYELLEELGRGGMGMVYKARQVRLKRLVALKMLLSAGQVAPETLARFRTEAEALAKLQHPNVIPIYDIGDHEGRPYFTMEYVAGPNLGQWLDHRPQDPTASAHLIEVVARAVQAVHEQGVVHRDLKPANILLAPAFGRGSGEGERPRPEAGANWTPKITDFGLAKDLTAGRLLTRTGLAMGTPCYMAPEQARGGADRAGPGVDIYALGSVLYEMLTGRPPFEADSPAATIAQLLHDEPLPPSRLRPALPRDLVTICMKCLEKAPRKRYTSAGELAEDLRRFQAGEPIRARPVGRVERAYRWCRRRPLVTGLLALSGFLVAAFIVTVLIYNARLQEALANAEGMNEEERQQIVHLNVIIGMAHLEAGDTFMAVLRFSEALRLDEGDPERERAHRVRIGTALRHCPKLAGLWSQDQEIICASLGAAGGRVATVGASHAVTVWDVPAGRAVSAALPHAEAPHSGAFSPDKRMLATVSGQGTVRLWDIDTGKSHELPLGKNRAIPLLAFHPDGRLLLVQHAPAVPLLWDLAAQAPVAWPSLSSNEVAFAVLSDNARWLLTLDGRHRAQVWDVATRKAAGPALPVGPGVRLAAVSADGKRLALIGPDRSLTVWDVPGAGRLARPVPLSHDVSLLVLSPNGERLFMAGGDRAPQVWKAQTGELLASLAHAAEAITAARFSPDGRWLLTGQHAGGARVWDAATGLAVTPPLRHGGNLVAAAFSADGSQVVTAGKGGTVCFWQLPAGPEASDGVADGGTTGTLRPPRPGEPAQEQRVRSPDGRRVVRCDNDTTARVWEVATGEPVTPPLRHRAAVRLAGFSPDGSRLITASAEGTVRVWQVPTGEQLAPPLHTARAIASVFFRDDGERACVAYKDGVVSTWDLAPDTRPVAELVTVAEVHACSHVGTKQEWQALAGERLRMAWERLPPER
jgi:WD40 repeat protein